MSQPDHVMDRAATKMEIKTGKAVSAIEKGANVLGNVQQGCTFLLINLFLCGFFSWGAYDAFIGMQLERNGETTPGTVIALDEHSDGGITYAPVVEYQVDGRTYSFTSSSYSSPSEYEVGEAVTVRYDRANPKTAQIESSWADRWLFPLIMVPVLLIAAIVVNFFFIRAWRRGEDLDLG